MTTKLDIKTTGKWLERLRRSTAAGSEPVELEQLGDYAIWLAADFPPSVFTAESAKHIAEQSQFFPKWAVLRAALVDWQDAHPAVPRIAFQPSEAVRARVEELQDGHAYFRRAADERATAKDDWSDPVKVRASVANLERNAAPGMRLLLGRMLANLVHRHAPENLGFVPPEYHP
ncbi:MAG TPA: hypothetical protein VIM11_18310 [Tepidisphaeraceae bacterium]|jgi:hypothetical protein